MRPPIPFNFVKWKRLQNQLCMVIILMTISVLTLVFVILESINNNFVDKLLKSDNANLIKAYLKISLLL